METRIGEMTTNSRSTRPMGLTAAFDARLEAGQSDCRQRPPLARATLRATVHGANSKLRVSGFFRNLAEDVIHPLTASVAAARLRVTHRYAVLSVAEIAVSA